MLYDGRHDEYMQRSIGHRDYGMYGYDMKLNHVIGNHDITLGYRIIMTT